MQIPVYLGSGMGISTSVPSTDHTTVTFGDWEKASVTFGDWEKASQGTAFATESKRRQTPTGKALPSPQRNRLDFL